MGSLLQWSSRGWVLRCELLLALCARLMCPAIMMWIASGRGAQRRWR